MEPVVGAIDLRLKEQAVIQRIYRESPQAKDIVLFGSRSDPGADAALVPTSGEHFHQFLVMTAFVLRKCKGIRKRDDLLAQFRLDSLFRPINFKYKLIFGNLAQNRVTVCEPKEIPYFLNSRTSAQERHLRP